MKMSVIRGKFREYLGMTLDYTACGQVSITVFSCIWEFLTLFDKAYLKGKGTKSSVAPKNIFVVKKDCKKLDQENFMDCHNLVSKILYATKRARPDTCTAIASLTTMLQAPKEDNWDKSVHLIQYIRGTRKLSLTLSANGSGILKWWVDASFAVHHNMQGYSGGGLSLWH